jgi:L-lactate dehydrogenase (cytochrome)
MHGTEQVRADSPGAPMPQMIQTLRSVLQFEKIETDGVARRLRRAANIGDLRRLAKRRMPRGCFDYIDGGAEDELTMRGNTAAFSSLQFDAKVLRDVETVDPSVTLLGRTLPIPLILAPTGFTRIADPQGELAVARSAARAGLPYALSTLGTRSIEEVAAVSEGPKWFQVYVWKDRGLVEDMLARATACGYETIILTVDTAVFGRRERDVRRGFSLPPKIGPGTLVDGAVHPSWTWAFLRSEPIRFANVAGKNVGDGSTAVALADYVNSQFDASMSWKDIEWLRSHWNGPVVLKGIGSPPDAAIAVDVGVDAVMVSNHGGRQLDTAPATVSLIAPVVQTVGGRIPIICDGGIRRGSDIVKALCLGATACSIGRAYLYGLGAGGQRGVDHALGLLDAGVRRTMALIGARSASELDPSFLLQ